MPAVTNADWNQNRYGKSKTVLGKYEGRPVGNELFWDDKRVGYFPASSKNQAVSNYNSNVKKYPQKYVLGRFEGYALGDYWWTSVTERKAWPSYRENCWSNDGTYWLQTFW